MILARLRDQCADETLRVGADASSRHPQLRVRRPEMNQGREAAQ